MPQGVVFFNYEDAIYQGVSSSGEGILIFDMPSAAQARGHEVWHYDVKSLALDEGQQVHQQRAGLQEVAVFHSSTRPSASNHCTANAGVLSRMVRKRSSLRRRASSPACPGSSP